MNPISLLSYDTKQTAYVFVNYSVTFAFGILKHLFYSVFQSDADESVNVYASKTEEIKGVLIKSHSDSVHHSGYMLAHKSPVRAAAAEAYFPYSRKKSPFGSEYFLEFFREFTTYQLLKTLYPGTAFIDDLLAVFFRKSADPDLNIVR